MNYPLVQIYSRWFMGSKLVLCCLKNPSTYWEQLIWQDKAVHLLRTRDQALFPIYVISYGSFVHEPEVSSFAKGSLARSEDGSLTFVGNMSVTTE